MAVREAHARGRLVSDGHVEAYLRERRPEGRALRLQGDASTRSYYRLEDGSGILAVHPEPFQPGAFPFLEVRALLEAWDLPVPKLLDVDGPRGILLLEDLGDETLQVALRGGAVPDGLYVLAVDQLVALQRSAASGPRTAACFSSAFDTEKLSWELHYFVKHFLEGLRKRELSVTDRVSLQEAFHTLASEIASWPRVLCHRDFHSRNLMRFHETLYWIDFQDARLGPAHYDLVSLLRDSYVDLGDDFIEEMAARFRERALPGEDPALFRRRFDLVALQRNLKALGTFGFMTCEKGRTVYLPYVPGTLGSVRKGLRRLAEFDTLQRVLAHHVEELQ